jgi:DNA-binding transcriptional MocR family regulator
MLGVSRETVVRSYEYLPSPGDLKSSTGVGTFVTLDVPAEPGRRSAAEPAAAQPPSRKPILPAAGSQENPSWTPVSQTEKAVLNAPDDPT